MSIIEHSNCSKYIYSKGVIDNTAKHWADVVIMWLISMVMFAHEYVMRSTHELNIMMVSYKISLYWKTSWYTKII